MSSSRLVTSIANRISARSRASKWQQFMCWAAPTPQDTILDIGVNTTEYSPTDNYLERHYPHQGNITALSVNDDWQTFKERYPAVKTVVGDGRSLPFADNQFSIAYSNAVVEHVGDTDKQIAFVREMYRVARRGYLTTPNRNFPVETHTRVPLLHLALKKDQFDRFLVRIGKSFATGDYMNLLSEKQLKFTLECAGVHAFHVQKNRFAGLPLTFTVTWTKGS